MRRTAYSADETSSEGIGGFGDASPIKRSTILAEGGMRQSVARHGMIAVRRLSNDGTRARRAFGQCRPFPSAGQW